MKMPHSPFATRLSGSAKETELRLRSIFQWKKKRPPTVLLILAVLVALFCGSLVSCQPGGEEPPLGSDIPPEDTVLDGNTASEDMEEPRELTAASGQDGLVSSQIELMFLPLESKLYQEPMEGLTGEQKELLENLPVSELPKEAVEKLHIQGLYYEDVWRDTLIPMAADEEADVTLYGVVNAEKFSEDPVSHAVNILAVDGVVLRAGERAAYYPLRWENVVYGGENPLMLVRDFDGDGKAEAAVCLRVSHGTGISVSNLYFFDLDTMTYTVPDYSAFGEIETEYDPAAHTLTLTSPAARLTVDVPDYLEPRGEGTCGNIVCFDEKEGQIYCHVALDFRAVAAYAAAPVLWQDGGYGLGEITLSDTFEWW